MTEFRDAAILMAVLLCASGLGLVARPLLSDRHRSHETAEVMQLVVTMLVTFAALVLGLLITSAKASFDAIDTDVRGYASDLTELNRLLNEYGPDTAPIRQALRSYTAVAIASTWTGEKPPPGDYYPKSVRPAVTDAPIESSGLGEMLAHIELRLRELVPTDAIHQRLLTRHPQPVRAPSGSALEIDRGGARFDFSALLPGTHVLARHRVRQLRPHLSA